MNTAALFRTDRILTAEDFHEAYCKTNQTDGLLKAENKTIPMAKISFPPHAPLAEEFRVTRNHRGRNFECNLKTGFLHWATGHGEEDSPNYYNIMSDWSYSPISEDDIPSSLRWEDIYGYIKGKRTCGFYANSKKQKALRRETAEKLFNQYLQNGLTSEDKKELEKEWNKRFNNSVSNDAKNKDLFVDGMRTWKDNKPFMLYKQQIDGVSFLMQKGNGLLAYDVGVGKTAVGIIVAVSHIQTGRADKPLIVVPKAVYSKWIHDIEELFPLIPLNKFDNCNEKSLARYKKNGEVIIPPGTISICTHEALQNFSFNPKHFERSGILFESFEAVCKTARDSSLNQKEFHVDFELFGFNALIVDEAHRFKNLFKIPRDAGSVLSGYNEYSSLGTGIPSKRALKLFGMTQLIHFHNNNKGVFLLTATPFTNSPLEIFSMLSYIARKELEKRHLFDSLSFCKEYAQITEEDVVTAKGTITTKSIMKSFRSVKSLQNLLREVIDQIDGEDAGIIRPIKQQHKVILSPTPVQKAIFEHEVNRMLEPESKTNGGILVAMNNMRMACVSPALLESCEYNINDFPTKEEIVESSPKLQFVCDTVCNVWKQKTLCGQVIYMPYGVKDIGNVKEYLVKKGIPSSVIGIIAGSSLSEVKIDALIEKFNDKNNDLKIIIGSKKISEGMDLNGNTIALYNCLLDWNPTETLQVEGRIWRQGNNQSTIHAVYPLIENSIESLIFQKHDEKTHRINSLFDYSSKKDVIDVSQIDPSELKFNLITDAVKRADYFIEQAKHSYTEEKDSIEKQQKMIRDFEWNQEQLQKEFTSLESEITNLESTIKQTQKVKKLLERLKKDRTSVKGKLKRLESHSIKINIESPEKIAYKKAQIATEYRNAQTKLVLIEEKRESIIEREKEKIKQLKKNFPTLDENISILSNYILHNTSEINDTFFSIHSVESPAKKSNQSQSKPQLCNGINEEQNLESINDILSTINIEIEQTLKEQNPFVDLIKEDPKNIKIVPKHLLTKNLILEALYDDATALKYIENQDAEICDVAVSRNPSVIQFVKKEFLTPALINSAAWHDMTILTLLSDKTRESFFERQKERMGKPEDFFTPTVTKDKILDYTAVPIKNIKIPDFENIRQTHFPTWLPPIHNMEKYNYNIPADKIGDNAYVIADGNKKYKVSLDVYAGLIKYNAEKNKAYDIKAPIRLTNECAQDVKQKLFDMQEHEKEQKENLAWTVGRETAYGDSKTKNALYEQYGVLVKRQNGNIITQKEIQELQEVLQYVYSVFGNLRDLAKEFALKVSHSGKRQMHAMNFSGVFIDIQNAIGISFAGGIRRAKTVAIHEFSHLIDYLKGTTLDAHYASDIEGSLENTIARMYRNLTNAQASFYSDYMIRTCECFARAMEQYAELTTGYAPDEEDTTRRTHTLNEERTEKFVAEILPLIETLIEENKREFGLGKFVT